MPGSLGDTPSRPYTATSFNSLPRAWAMISPISLEVPLGASFFHWSCISRISISISSFRVVATSSSNLFIILTNLEVLAAYSIGITLEASIKRCISSSVNPVVPHTSAFLWEIARDSTSIAISFVEKSIMTSQPSITLSKSSVTGTPSSRPTMATVPRSFPMYSRSFGPIPATSSMSSLAAATCVINFPIFPRGPTTITFII